MTVVTVVRTLTDTIVITPTDTLYETSTTTTSYFVTVPATAGEVLTLVAPAPIISPPPTAWYLPTIVPTNIYTVTELDIFLQAPGGNIWSTVTLDATTSPGTPFGASPSQVLVVPSPQSGWDSWSEAAKVGLIVGVVLGALLLLCLCCCLQRRRAMWFTHEMPNWYGVGPMAGPKPSVILRGGGEVTGGCRFGLWNRRRTGKGYRGETTESELKDVAGTSTNRVIVGSDRRQTMTIGERADKGEDNERHGLMAANNDRDERRRADEMEELQPVV